MLDETPTTRQKPDITTSNQPKMKQVKGYNPTGQQQGSQLPSKSGPTRKKNNILKTNSYQQDPPHGVKGTNLSRPEALFSRGRRALVAGSTKKLPPLALHVSPSSQQHFHHSSTNLSNKIRTTSGKDRLNWIGFGCMFYFCKSMCCLICTAVDIFTRKIIVFIVFHCLPILRGHWHISVYDIFLSTTTSRLSTTTSFARLRRGRGDDGGAPSACFSACSRR
jgi:hypothetical protein